MNSNIRNIIITAVLALFIGYMVGGISQTGRCPITGRIICKERAAACCNKEKECPAENQATPVTPAAAEATAPAAPATETGK